MLNIGIFAVSLYTSERKVTADTEAIKQILQSNGITLDCEIPTTGEARKLLNLSTAEWDYEYIKNTFFANENDVTRTNEEGSIIYRSLSSGATVTISNFGTIDAELVYREHGPAKPADEYLKLLGAKFDKFELVREFAENDKVVYIFNEKRNDYAIFQSYVEAATSRLGTVLRVKKLNFVSYAEGVHDIFGADEALLTFSHYKSENITGDIVIEGISLGYGAEARPYEQTWKAKPHYRIFIKGERTPVYIDAIMNVVV